MTLPTFVKLTAMKNTEQFHWPLAIPFTFSVVVMILCVYKLVAGVPDNEKALYWGGVSSLLAYWLPSPVRLSDNHSSRKESDSLPSTGLQIVQHPASNNLESSHSTTNGILRYQNGERQTW